MNKTENKGKLSVIGTGPGNPEHMTAAAEKAVLEADIIIGYKTYLEQIPELLEGKDVLSSTMMQEVERCRKALGLAEEGRKVALICGGDPGIYAMAGLVLELAAGSNSEESDIEVVPGLAALNSCAARLGAPLMHDFAAISLSDLLTPWPLIEKRLSAAAEADFVIVIYNPRSKKRRHHLNRAQELIMAHRDSETPVGIVTAAGRVNEKITITSLNKMAAAEVGMQSTVIVGNSTTFRWQDFMITPRGYADKYGLEGSAQGGA
ncbi:precorrin-3B C(17)-methyltransferase [Desulfobacterota bacterium M19]